MNCQLLQQAIAQNQQLAESIQQQLNQINETGQASKNQLQQLENSLAEALAQSEQTLTNFVPDFKEAFNLLETCEYSDEIEGFNSVIRTTLQLADGNILVAGEEGEIRLLQPQPDGSYKYSDWIDMFGNNKYTTLQLADGNILVAGRNGETRLLQLQFAVRQAQDIRDRAEEILG